mgnify:CR=1 FL=1
MPMQMPMSFLMDKIRMMNLVSLLPQLEILMATVKTMLLLVLVDVMTTIPVVVLEVLIFSLVVSRVLNVQMRMPM